MSLFLCAHCSSPVSTGAASLKPVRKSFETFDRWARRSIGTTREQSLAAVEEALFAPVRRDDLIVAARVQREGVDECDFSFRAKALSVTGTQIKDPQLGVLTVSDTSLAVAGVPIPVTIVSREVSESSGGQVRVSVAFRRARNVNE